MWFWRKSYVIFVCNGYVGLRDFGMWFWYEFKKKPTKYLQIDKQGSAMVLLDLLLPVYAFQFLWRRHEHQISYKFQWKSHTKITYGNHEKLSYVISICDFGMWFRKSHTKKFGNHEQLNNGEEKQARNTTTVSVQSRCIHIKKSGLLFLPVRSKTPKHMWFSI